MYSNPSLDSGEPVEQIVLSFDNLYFDEIFNLRRTSMYFALKTNKVIFSFYAIFHNNSTFL